MENIDCVTFLRSYFLCYRISTNIRIFSMMKIEDDFNLRCSRAERKFNFSIRIMSIGTSENSIMKSESFTRRRIKFYAELLRWWGRAGELWAPLANANWFGEAWNQVMTFLCSPYVAISSAFNYVEYLPALELPRSGSRRFCTAVSSQPTTWQAPQRPPSDLRECCFSYEQHHPTLCSAIKLKLG